MLKKVTEAMEKEVLNRLPDQTIFDFVGCNNCDFIGLVEVGSEVCPVCAFNGAFMWAGGNDDQEHEIGSLPDNNDCMLDAITSNGKDKTLPEAAPQEANNNIDQLQELIDTLTEIANDHYRLAEEVRLSKRAYKYHMFRANKLTAAADTVIKVKNTLPSHFSA